MKYIRDHEKTGTNSTMGVLIAYDLQAGTYIDIVEHNKEFTLSYCLGISQMIDSFKISSPSVLEVGVGEATTLSHVVNQMQTPPSHVSGIDISWSRVKFGQSYFKKYNPNISSSLAVGDLFNMPFADSSVDVVYTSHSLEPNGGKEVEALKELYRVAREYIVLLEPSFENADDEGKKRMLENGYIMNLATHARSLKYDVISQFPYQFQSNKKNPTEVIVIKKNNSKSVMNTSHFSCPISKLPLTLVNGGLFCKESLLTYPVILDIPCLTPDNAILTSKLSSFAN